MRTELTGLLHQHPLVFFHLATAFAALLLGGVLLARRKRTAQHRAMGWAWCRPPPPPGPRLRWPCFLVPHGEMP